MRKVIIRATQTNYKDNDKMPLTGSHKMEKKKCNAT